MAIFNLFSLINLPSTVEHDPHLEFVQLTSYKFHIRTFGKKHNPPVLVVHGGPGGDFNYLLPLKELSRDYFIIFYDQRGTGLSPRVPIEEITLESSLEDLSLLIEHFKMNDRIKLIGHSWGAMLVSGYLCRFGNRVSHAVIVEPGILNVKSAVEFVKIERKNQSIFDLFYLIGAIFLTPFVSNKDGNERFDFVMTKILNRNRPGGIYQCEKESMPENSFIRAGFVAFNKLLNPVLKNPKKFTADLT